MLFSAKCLVVGRIPEITANYRACLCAFVYYKTTDGEQVKQTVRAQLQDPVSQLQINISKNK